MHGRFFEHMMHVEPVFFNGLEAPGPSRTAVHVRKETEVVLDKFGGGRKRLRGDCLAVVDFDLRRPRKKKGPDDDGAAIIVNVFTARRGTKVHWHEGAAR